MLLCFLVYLRGCEGDRHVNIFESTWIPSGMTCGPTSHDGFRGLVALAAVGQLSGDEALYLEVHLQDCEGCRTDLLELNEVASLLSLASNGNPLRPPTAN